MPTHSLQARLDPSKTDRRLYDANRDIAHNFAAVTTEVAKRLTHRKWCELYDSLNTTPTEEELGEVCQAFIKFVASAVEKPEEIMAELLHRSGFLQCTHASQVAFMATLGQVLTGMYFHGARMATTGGEGPCSDLRALIQAGRQTSIIFAAPPWKRRWWRLTSRFTRAIHAFRSSSNETT